MIFHKYYQHIIIPASALPIINFVTSAPSSSSFILLYCSQGGFSARKVPNSLRQRFKGEQPEAQSLSSLSPSSSTSSSGNFQHVQLQIETEAIVKGPGVEYILSSTCSRQLFHLTFRFHNSIQGCWRTRQRRLIPPTTTTTTTATNSLMTSGYITAATYCRCRCKLNILSENSY